MARRCAREACSGTTPPKRACRSVCDAMTLDSISTPSRTTATAVSSQLVSKPRMRVTAHLLREVEDEDARGDQTVQATAVEAGADLTYAGQGGIAQLAQDGSVGGGVQDAGVRGVGQVQTTRSIGRDGTHRRRPRVRGSDHERPFLPLGVEVAQRAVVHAQIHVVLLPDNLRRLLERQAWRRGVIQQESRWIDRPLAQRRVLQESPGAAVEHIQAPFGVGAQRAKLAPRGTAWHRAWTEGPIVSDLHHRPRLVDDRQHAQLGPRSAEVLDRHRGCQGPRAGADWRASADQQRVRGRLLIAAVEWERAHRRLDDVERVQRVITHRQIDDVAAGRTESDGHGRADADDAVDRVEFAGRLGHQRTNVGWRFDQRPVLGQVERVGCERVRLRRVAGLIRLGEQGLHLVDSGQTRRRVGHRIQRRNCSGAKQQHAEEPRRPSPYGRGVAATSGRLRGPRLLEGRQTRACSSRLDTSARCRSGRGARRLVCQQDTGWPRAAQRFGEAFFHRVVTLACAVLQQDVLDQPL